MASREGTIALWETSLSLKMHSARWQAALQVAAEVTCRVASCHAVVHSCENPELAVASSNAQLTKVRYEAGQMI